MVWQGVCPLACPYFIPTEPHPLELWPHRHRLPLGDGYAGSCAARPAEPCCEDESLRLHCNLGYAEMGNTACEHLPVDREFDAVRFWVSSGESGLLRVQFGCERAHRPALCGELRYDRAAGKWVAPPDPQVMRLAEAVIRAWLGRHD